MRVLLVKSRSTLTVWAAKTAKNLLQRLNQQSPHSNNEFVKSTNVLTESINVFIQLKNVLQKQLTSLQINQHTGTSYQPISQLMNVSKKQCTSLHFQPTCRPINRHT